MEDGINLLDALREELGCRSVKDGCSPQGQCGCCTVWVDGAPRVACVTPVRRIAGRRVTTLGGSAGGTAPALGRRLRPTRRQPVRLLHARHRPAPGRARERPRAAATTGATSRRPCGRTCAGARAGSPLWRRPAARWASRVRRRRPRAILATRSWPRGAPRSRGPAFQSSGREVVLGAGGFADDTAPPDALVQLGADGALAPSLRTARARRGRVQGRNSTVPLSHPVDVARGRLGPDAADVVAGARLRRARRQLGPAGPAPRLSPGQRRRLRGQAAQSGTERAPGRWPAPRATRCGCCGAVRTSFGAGPSARRWPWRCAPTGAASCASVARRVRPTGSAAGPCGSDSPDVAVELVDVAGPPVSPDLRGAGWAEVLAARAALDAARGRGAGFGDVHVAVPGAGSARVDLHLDEATRGWARGRRVGRRRPLSRDAPFLCPRCGAPGARAWCGARGSPSTRPGCPST